MTNFVYCPRCGTRNFADDLTCGICKYKLPGLDGVGKILPDKTVSKDDSGGKISFPILGVIIVGLGILFYFLTKKPAIEKEDLSLLKTHKNNKRTFTFTVNIADKVSEAELIKLAEKFVDDVSVSSETGTIFFYVSGMNLNGAPWAKVDFNPTPIAEILGSTNAQDSDMMSFLNTIDDFYGLWYNAEAGDNRITRISRKGNKFFLDYIYPQEGINEARKKELVVTEIGGSEGFVERDNPAYYYIIQENGDLLVHNANGRIEYDKLLKLNP